MFALFVVFEEKSSGEKKEEEKEVRIQKRSEVSQEKKRRSQEKKRLQHDREEAHEEEADNLVRESKQDTGSHPASVTRQPGCLGPQKQSGPPPTLAKEADISFSVTEPLVDSQVLCRE